MGASEWGRERGRVFAPGYPSARGGHGGPKLRQNRDKRCLTLFVSILDFARGAM
jgi:hypothetical protein